MRSGPEVKLAKKNDLMDIGILSREVVQFNTCRSPFGGKLHPIL